MEITIKIQLTINGKFYATGHWALTIIIHQRCFVRYRKAITKTCNDSPPCNKVKVFGPDEVALT